MAQLCLICAQLLWSCLLLAALLMSRFIVIVCATNNTDMLAFKAEIASDPFESLNSWNDSTDFCRCYGVICSRRYHKVTVLHLRSQGLSGSISPHIGNLSFLNVLALQNNSFGLEIPPQIGQLHRLKFLYLSNNSLTGEIPRNISGWSNLIHLVLEGNQSVGGIPGELGSLSILQAVNFHPNQLIGSIPSSLGNLSSLEQIYLAYNRLSGIIPESLGRLTKLQLYLDMNRLLGTIPPSIFNLSSLITFTVGGNQIHGNLPEDIGFTLPNLQVLSIYQNQFAGSIPLSISNATNLKKLQFAGNELSGKVPLLANLHNLQKVTLDTNYLGSGGSYVHELSFLCSLTNAPNLKVLTMNENRFGGMLPLCIGNFSATFMILLVGQNMISGKIPREICNLVNLQVLHMRDNHLSSPIPSDLGVAQ